MSNKTYDIEINIDTSIIPDYVRDSLAVAILDFIKGLKKIIQKQIRCLKKRKKNWGYNNVTPKAENNLKNNFKILCFGFSYFFKS